MQLRKEEVLWTFYSPARTYRRTNMHAPKIEHFSIPPPKTISHNSFHFAMLGIHRLRRITRNRLRQSKQMSNRCGHINAPKVFHRQNPGRSPLCFLLYLHCQWSDKNAARINVHAVWKRLCCCSVLLPLLARFLSVKQWKQGVGILYLATNLANSRNIM